MAPPEPLDGLYIRWQGRIRPAHGTAYPPGTVLVELDHGEESPARYERDDGDDRWIYVPKGELEEMFSLRTYCRWRGTRCQVEWLDGDRIRITAAGFHPERARELGMTLTFERGIYTKELTVSEVTDLVQERHDIPLT